MHCTPPIAGEKPMSRLEALHKALTDEISSPITEREEGRVPGRSFSPPGDCRSPLSDSESPTEAGAPEEVGSDRDGEWELDSVINPPGIDDESHKSPFNRIFFSTLSNVESRVRYLERIMVQQSQEYGSQAVNKDAVKALYGSQRTGNGRDCRGERKSRGRD